MDGIRVGLSRFIETETRLMAGLAVSAAPADLQPVAVGWATVELERATAELAGSLGLGSDAFVHADEDVALGARCLVAPGVLDAPGARSRLGLVLLEPSTEGRLAATLARNGEGPAAIWLGADDPAGVVAAIQATGSAIAASRDGPLGPARLLLAGPVHGPHRFLVARRPGTIR